MALAVAATMSLAVAAAASAEQVPGSDPPASMDGLPLAYPDQASIDASIPPICTIGVYTCGTFETIFGQLPPSDPANGENGATDYAHSFDAWAVDASGAPADTLNMNSTYTADAYDIASSRSYVHCSYHHHHGHHYRARNGVLYHHYHNSSTGPSYWSSYNTDWLEVYRHNSC